MFATYRKGGELIAGTVGFVEVFGEGHRVSRRRAGVSRFRRTCIRRGCFRAPLIRPRLPVAFAACLIVLPITAMAFRRGRWSGTATKTSFAPGPRKESFPVIWAESVTSDGRSVWRSEKRNHAPWFTARRPKDDWLIVTQPCVLLQRTTAKEQARRLLRLSCQKALFGSTKG